MMNVMPRIFGFGDTRIDLSIAPAGATGAPAGREPSRRSAPPAPPPPPPPTQPQAGPELPSGIGLFRASREAPSDGLALVLAPTAKELHAISTAGLLGSRKLPDLAACRVTL